MKKVSRPAVSTSALEPGRRDTAGTNVTAPTSTPKAVAQATAASAAGRIGQPNSTWK